MSISASYQRVLYCCCFFCPRSVFAHGRQGKGVDRHLFALLCMAKRKVEESTAAAAAAAAAESERKAVAEGRGEEGTSPACPPPYEIPSLFEDEAWRVLNHVILSTRYCIDLNPYKVPKVPHKEFRGSEA